MADQPAVDIRLLAPDDVALLEAMSTMFAEAFDEPKTYTAERPRREYLQNLLGGDSFIALAAVSSGEIVGGIAAYELHKFEQERSEIYLYDLAVAAGHRRQGIATALIEELRRVARRRGAWVVFVQADRGDTPAESLYEKLGTREDIAHFDIAVREQES